MATTGMWAVKSRLDHLVNYVSNPLKTVTQYVINDSKTLEKRYVEINGLLYPDLKLSEQKEVHLSRFGRMKKQYLKEEHSIIYINLLVSGKLFDYLENFDNEMNELYNRLVEQYKINWNVTEELKGKDQMRWIQEMNNIQQCVEEFIKSEYIYQ